jgi:chemotaxis protein methyltransferase CheR
MTLVDAIPNIAQWDIKILATDIDSNVLKTGKSGVYDLSRVENLDKSLLKRHFKKGTDTYSGKVRVNSNLRELVKFKQLNLLERWPVNEKMDFIFCRNVVIYFDKPTKSKLVDRFGDHLADKGHLFMEHSESLHQDNDRFKLLGKTVYQIGTD